MPASFEPGAAELPELLFWPMSEAISDMDTSVESVTAWPDVRHAGGCARRIIRRLRAALQRCERTEDPISCGPIESPMVCCSSVILCLAYKLCPLFSLCNFLKFCVMPFVNFVSPFVLCLFGFLAFFSFFSFFFAFFCFFKLYFNFIRYRTSYPFRSFVPFV